MRHHLHIIAQGAREAAPVLVLLFLITAFLLGCWFLLLLIPWVGVPVLGLLFFGGLFYIVGLMVTEDE